MVAGSGRVLVAQDKDGTYTVNTGRIRNVAGPPKPKPVARKKAAA